MPQPKNTPSSPARVVGVLSVFLLAIAFIFSVANAERSPLSHRAESFKKIKAAKSDDLLPNQGLDSIRRISLPTKDLIIDKTTNLIYASVPGFALGRGNTLTQIDPVAGTILSSVVVGSEPNKLAISDNNQYIYISLDGIAGVRRFDIASQTPQSQFLLGVDPSFGPMLPVDIDVMPGAPLTVAVSRRFPSLSPGHAGVAIFDNGVQRPTVTNTSIGIVNRIEFSSSSSVLYGANTQTTALQLWRLSVMASGVSIVNQIGVESEFGDIEFDGGLLYNTNGRVFNPDTATTVGNYQGLTFAARSMVVDSANNRVYFLGGGGNESGQGGFTRIYAFNKTTFELISSYDLLTRGPVSSLVQWGPTGLAFRDDNTIYLVPTPGSGTNPPFPGPTPTPTPTPTPGVGQLRQISLPTKDLISVPGTQKVFASVPSSAGSQGNSLTLLDPLAGTFGAPIPIGSEPNKLAIIEDGSLIYAGLDGEAAIRTFDVVTQTPGTKFSISENAIDISPMPGNPNSIAVARNRSSPQVVVYDNGVPRQTTANGIPTIAFSNNPEVLYGYNGNTTAQTFSKMLVGSCGVGVTNQVNALLTGNDKFNVKYDNGRFYSGAGRVVDPEAATIVGSFFIPPFVNSFGSALVETDSKAKRIYSLATEFSVTTLHVFDMDTLGLVGALSLPTVTGTPIRLVRWGTDGLAFNTASQVYILQHPLIAPPSGTVTPAPPANGGAFTVTGSVMQLLDPVPDVTITYSGMKSGTIQTDAQGKFSIPNLGLCGTLTITPSKPNWTFTPSSLTLTNPRTSTANFSALHKIIGFVLPNVSVSESSSRVFLAIQKVAGIPSISADIDYASSNGTASARTDYTAAFGTFHFDAGTSQAPLEILLTDDAHVEGPETFTVTLQPIPGFDLVNPTVTVTIQDNDTSPPTSNPIDGPPLFVRQHYHDFLGRDPDSAGFAFWQSEITRCGNDAQCIEIKRINVSAAFFLSIEYQETGYFAYRIHKTAYGDASSPNVVVPVPIIRLDEFLRDSRQIGSGVVVGAPGWESLLNARKSAYVLSFVQRARFIAAYPISLSATEFVTNLDQNAGGVLTANEKNQLIAVLGSSPGDAALRASVVRSIADNSLLSQREFNRAFVLSQYFGYLRRNPDDTPDADFRGWEFWLNKLNEFQGDFIRAEMVKAFISSIEYRQRFAP